MSSFEWLENFHGRMEKPTNYAEKTLAAYKLGMRAKGSIIGVRIISDSGSCEACCALDKMAIYHPDEAPHLPVEGCDKPLHCSCVYRPVMAYEEKKTT